VSVKVVFVCWGNICRSLMAARVAEKRLAEEGLDAEVTSAGVSDEEHGGPMDRRARAVLDAHGYRSGGHHAHKITRAEIEGADLVVAAEPVHVSMMKRLAPDADIALLTDFDPAAKPGSGVPDPWYGGPEDFDKTLVAIESAMPGVVREVRRLSGQ